VANGRPIGTKTIRGEEMQTQIRKNCNPKDCKIVNGLCLVHGYSVSGKVKCEDYPEPYHMDTATRSTQEIKRFIEYKQNYISGKWKGYLPEKERMAAYTERLSGYLCSLTLGRDFNESVDSYFERKGLIEFDVWARQELFRLHQVAT